jgi:hypothetical protein
MTSRSSLQEVNLGVTRMVPGVRRNTYTEFLIPVQRNLRVIGGGNPPSPSKHEFISPNRYLMYKFLRHIKCSTVKMLSP